MWFAYPNQVYFNLIQLHKDKIIAEIGGHDHFTSMRYHTDKEIFDIDSPSDSDDSLYHNILVNPSMTPWYSNNPGVSAMEIDDETLVPHNYHATFMNLKPTIGKERRTPYQNLEFRDLDYQKQFDLKDMTPQGIHDLRVRLQKDPQLQHDFMIRKIGLDPEDAEERQQALEIFLRKGLVDEKTYSSWSQICLMAKSVSVSEFAACVAKDPWTTPQV